MKEIIITVRSAYLELPVSEYVGNHQVRIFTRTANLRTI